MDDALHHLRIHPRHSRRKVAAKPRVESRKIVENWKKTLTDTLYKDPSIYTMPRENAESETGVRADDSLQEDSFSSNHSQEPPFVEDEEIEIPE